jgi:hypothetical protein
VTARAFFYGDLGGIFGGVVLNGKWGGLTQDLGEFLPPPFNSRKAIQANMIMNARAEASRA